MALASSLDFPPQANPMLGGKIGVIGFGCPAGNAVEGNAFTSSSVFPSAERTFCFLLGVASPLGLLSLPSLFIASTGISSGAGISFSSGNSGSSFS